MTITAFPVRIFGGRNASVVFDSAQQTLTILGQSVSLSSFSAAIQAELTNAIATTPGAVTPEGSAVINPTGVAPFGGTNMQKAVGDAMDANATWRSAVQAAVNAMIAGNTANGAAGDPETFIR